LDPNNIWISRKKKEKEAIRSIINSIYQSIKDSKFAKFIAAKSKSSQDYPKNLNQVGTVNQNLRGVNQNSAKSTTQLNQVKKAVQQ